MAALIIVFFIVVLIAPGLGVVIFAARLPNIEELKNVEYRLRCGSIHMRVIACRI